MDKAQNEKRPGVSGGNDPVDAPTLPPVVGNLPHAGPTPASQGSPAAGSGNQPTLDFLAPPQGPDEIGRLGLYRVLKVLGQGGMGVVFQAEDVRLQRVVALKAMLPALAQTPEAKERFLREARAAAAIEHDNIVAIHQVDEDRGVPYIAMPFLKGASLESFLERKAAGGTRLKLAEMCKIGREIARGLAAAHERGLIHRDIKPANIWLDQSAGGRVKILDFGLARLSQQGNEKNLTQAGVILGTPAYMAPEQARGGNVDARTDLFSLGVVLYRMCTGAMPFRGPDMISTLMAVAMNEPPAPKSLHGDLPRELSDLVMQLLEKDPTRRPASAKDVVKAIAAIEKTSLSPRPTAAGRPAVSGERQDTIVEPQPSSPPGRPSGSRRALLPRLLGAGAVAGLVVVATLVMFRPRPQDTCLSTQGGSNGPENTPRVSPLSPLALVSRPPKIEGAQSWSIEPRGHRGSVYESVSNLLVAWRPDSKQLATGGIDGTVRLWEASSGELLGILLGHGKKITALAWSPDGKTLASGSDDATVHVWGPATGKLLVTFTKHAGPITALGWSRDGKTLGSGGEDKLVYLWGPRSGEVRQKFDGHHAALTGLGGGSENTFVSTDSNNILIWEAGTGKIVKSHQFKGRFRWDQVVIHQSGDKEFTVWEVAANRARSLTLKEHAGPIHSWDLSPDGTLLVTGGDKSLSCWDVASGKLLSTRSIWQGMTQTLSFSRDGRTLISREQYGNHVFLWPTAALRTNEVIKPVDLAPGLRFRDKIRWAPDSTAFCVTPYWDAQQDSARLAFFAASGRRLHTLFPNVHGGGDVAWSPDGQRLAVGHPLKRVRIQSAGSAKVLHVADEEPQAPASDFRSHLDWSLDGKTLAIYHGSQPAKAVRLFDAQTGSRLKNGFNGPPMRSVAWSPDSTKLATADDGAVYLYDAAGGKQISKRPIPALKDHALAWSPDSRVLATGGTSVKLWSAITGEAIATIFPVPGTIIQAVAWSPDGLTIASGDEAGTIRLYNAQSGAVLPAFQGHEGPIHCLAWMPDSSRNFLSLGEKDGQVGFWEVGPDKPLRVTKGLPGKARFSPDRKFLVSHHDPTGVQLWETETGQLCGTLLTIQGKPEQYIAVSADGHYRITGEASRQVVYVVQTADGQETLTPAEFERKYNWKNNPEKVHLTGPE